ncbi:hypothetical protein, partial [Shewanella algae]|uniref:hypothetical protein n=1 Tax=Shewanella algae TaxID=38313 RepID=UPI001C3FE324
RQVTLKKEASASFFACWRKVSGFLLVSPCVSLITKLIKNTIYGRFLCPEPENSRQGRVRKRAGADLSLKLTQLSLGSGRNE